MKSDRKKKRSNLSNLFLLGIPTIQMSLLSRQSNPWSMMPAVIKEMKNETPEVITFVIEMRDRETAKGYSVLPGQFNMLYVPGIGEAAISVSGNASLGRPLVHTIHAVGKVTNELARSSIGTSVGIRGPFGSHWPVDQCAGKDLVIVAGGIGLAPLRPVIYEVISRRSQFDSVSVLVGARSPDQLLYSDEFQQWKNAGIMVNSTVDQPDNSWNGNIGFVTHLLQQMNLPMVKNTILFTCGPEVMMINTIRCGIDRGITPENISLSLERHMNCAIGHCGHCQLGPHFICKDGPVLPYPSVADLMLVDAF